MRGTARDTDYTRDIPSLCIQLSVVTVGVVGGEGGELPEIQTVY